MTESTAAKLLGHKHAEMSYGQYGSGPTLILLNESIEKIKYDVQALKEIRNSPIKVQK